MVKKTGRPSDFTQDIADTICERLAEGESLRSICASDGMPRMSTVFRWLANDSHSQFREQYARSREEQAEVLADEIVQIADGDGEGADPQRDRLRVDARKWVAAKLKPKKYGDRQLIGSDPDNPLPPGFIVKLTKGPDA
jgi:hypothetical protein